MVMASNTDGASAAVTGPNATLGIAVVHFVATEKSERSYAQSTLWTSGEWRRHLVLGAEQAFATRLPAVSHGASLSAALATLPSSAVTRFALDNYEPADRLGAGEIAPGHGCAIAIGAERGWSASERDALRTAGFTFAHLGDRVLRTETAVVAALTLVRSKLGLT